MRIVVDAMGGDYAPGEIVSGAVQAARDFGGEIILVGREAEVKAALGDNARLPAIRIVHASDVIDMDEHPANAVKNKPDSSMVVGMKLVKAGEADAFVSMGNTGGALAAALFNLGRIKGVQRPALAALFPVKDGWAVMLDMGANADVRPDWLVQFGMMGSVYAERVLGVTRPRVGLVSNGEEETKGNQLVQEAHALFKASPLHFVGNVEGKDVMLGHAADVVVTDGFTGNIILKFAEAIAKMMRDVIREEIKRDPVSAVGGLMAKRAFDRVAARLDDSEHGGAPLLGVNGVVIIGHGRAKAYAVRNAIRTARQAVEKNIVAEIATGVTAAAAPAVPA